MPLEQAALLLKHHSYLERYTKYEPADEVLRGVAVVEGSTEVVEARKKMFGGKLL
jgi:hypothetical protein